MAKGCISWEDHLSDPEISFMAHRSDERLETAEESTVEQLLVLLIRLCWSSSEVAWEFIHMDLP